jgi:hypothetical protein
MVTDSLTADLVARFLCEADRRCGHEFTSWGSTYCRGYLPRGERLSMGRPLTGLPPDAAPVECYRAAHEGTELRFDRSRDRSHEDASRQATPRSTRPAPEQEGPP